MFTAVKAGSLREFLLDLLGADLLYTFRGQAPAGCSVGDFRGGESSSCGVLSPTNGGVWPVMSIASCLDGIFKAGGRLVDSLCWRRGFGATMTVVLVSRTAKGVHGSTDAENPN